MEDKYKDLHRAIEILCREKNLRVTVKYSGGCALVTGITTFLGGMMGGPAGIVVGAMIGGVGSATATKGQFRSAVDVLNEDLTLQQKLQLFRHVENALREINIIDIVRISMYMMNSHECKAVIVGEVIKFFQNELKYTIMQ